MGRSSLDRVSALLETNPRVVYAVSALALSIITWVDYATGYELGLFVLYFIPVGLSAWYGSRRAGVAFAVAAACCWYASDVLAGHPYAHLLLGWWETFMRLVSYLTTALTLSKIREIMRRQEDLLRVVSHDLKGPLAAIVGQARLLRNRAGEEPFVAGRSDAILRVAGRMDAMIDDLVDGARHESGHLRLALEPVQIRDLVVEMLGRMSGTLDVARIDLLVPAEPGLRVMADPNRLERIVLNLLSNALKYSPEPSRVAVDCESRNGRVILSVRDRGDGVSPQDLEHLFERYYRGSAAARAEGIGLGLHATRLLVRAHDGTIRVRNHPDGGAEFLVELPAIRDGVPATAAR